MRWIVLLVSSLVFVAGASAEEAVPSTSRQLVLVVTAGWDTNHGTLQTFERGSDAWQARTDAVPVTVGRAGSAWGIGLHGPQAGPQKREGDGRSPAGVFAIGSAFGYSGSYDTRMPYRAMTEADYCIDVNGSAFYNRIVDARAVGRAAVEKSTEPMRRDIHAQGDRRYKLGFVIEHNSQNVAAKGSCIFAHLWGSPGQPTAGCTAMDEAAMRDLLAWLDDELEPVFVLLPYEVYQRVRRTWQLPAEVAAPK